MIVKKVQYNPPTEYLFLDQKRKMGIIKKIKKQMSKFDINPDDIETSNNLIINTDFLR